MTDTEHYDLIIVGTGSGNSIPDDRFDHMRIAIVEEARFGGTCLNVGCIPTKMFAYPAEVAAEAHRARGLGITFATPEVDWQRLQTRIFSERVDPIAVSGEEYRRGPKNPNVDVYPDHARFVGPRTLRVGDAVITGEQIVVAAGSRPVIPPQFADSAVTVRTNEDIMRVPEFPRRLVIVGGGYIAMEFAHIFSHLGSDVTVLVRSGAALRHLDDDLVRRFNNAVATQWTMRYHTEVQDLNYTDSGTIRLRLDDSSSLEADEVLVATGRVSNADRLDVAAGGLELDGSRLRIDEYGRCPGDAGVWALGDVAQKVMLKHSANAQARVIQHNVLHPDNPHLLPQDPVPSAVFSYPQVATVGMTESEARASGRPITVASHEMKDVAYGWAMGEDAGLVKLVADADSGKLLGAHLLGPQAATLIQPLVTALSFDIDMRRFSRGQYWIHPALPEVVENAALKLEFQP